MGRERGEAGQGRRGERGGAGREGRGRGRDAVEHIVAIVLSKCGGESTITE